MTPEEAKTELIKSQSELKLIAESCSKDAIKWRKRFRILGWIDISYTIIFLPWGIFVCLTQAQYAWLYGSLMISLAIGALIRSKHQFLDAEDKYDQLMKLRQDSLMRSTEIDHFLMWIQHNDNP